MKKACIINTYIKRYWNLMLLSYQQEEISVSELKLAFSESLEYLKLSNIIGHITGKEDFLIGTRKALLFYELFQTAIEHHLESMRAVLMSVNEKSDIFSLNMQIDMPQKSSLAEALSEKLTQEPDFSYKEAIEEDTLYLEFSVVRGAK